jgi:hypothetical protein
MNYKDLISKETNQDKLREYEVLAKIESMIMEMKASHDVNFMYNLMTGVILNNYNKPLTAAGRILMKCADCQRVDARADFLIGGVMVGCENSGCPLHYFMCEKRYGLTDKEVYTED